MILKCSKLFKLWKLFKLLVFCGEQRDFVFWKNRKQAFQLELTKITLVIIFLKKWKIMPPVCPDLSPTQIAKERMGLIETFQCIICIQTAKSTHLCPKVRRRPVNSCAVFRVFQIQAASSGCQEHAMGRVYRVNFC